MGLKSQSVKQVVSPPSFYFLVVPRQARQRFEGHLFCRVSLGGGLFVHGRARPALRVAGVGARQHLDLSLLRGDSLHPLVPLSPLARAEGRQIDSPHNSRGMINASALAQRPPHSGSVRQLVNAATEVRTSGVCNGCVHVRAALGAWRTYCCVGAPASHVDATRTRVPRSSSTGCGGTRTARTRTQRRRRR